MEEHRIGSHLLCDVWTESPIGHIGEILPVLVAAISAGGATLLDLFTKQFSPGGVSAVAIIGESHIAIHTWPEVGFVSVEAFTCTTAVDLDAIVSVLTEAFDPVRLESQVIERGKYEDSASVPATFRELEPGSPGVRAYPVSRMIEERATKFQDLAIFESPGLGRVLTLDHIIQVADVDSYLYHELLVHPAMCSHLAPRFVVIVGGGDGLALSEVLKHDVERVIVFELDEEVVDACRSVFPAGSSFDDPRVECRFGDAYDSMFDTGPIDVIICDMTDPIGQAGRFFEEEFMARAATALGDSGVMAMQSESLHFHSDVVRRVRAAAQSQFRFAATVTGAMATYPGAWWTFTVCSNASDPRVPVRRPRLDTRLYDAGSHEWFFIPDDVLERVLASGGDARPAFRLE